MWIGPIINFDMQYYTNNKYCTKEFKTGGVIFALLTRTVCLHLVFDIKTSYEE